MLSVHARLSPNRIGARDLDRAMTFAQWNERSCRLANALLGLGLAKGDRVAILAYNCVEWCEIFAAAAKAGLVALPINFRLVGKEVQFIVDNAEASAFIVQDELVGVVEEIRKDISIKPDRFVHFGTSPCPAGYRPYEDFLAAGSAGEPNQQVGLSDPWTLMYTSGTTGNPKGVVRSHRSAVLLSMVTEIELGLHRKDGALLVMPMCHANSLNFFGAFGYCGGVNAIYSRKSFDPEHCARTLAEEGSTFTSLVPTHYIMMLDLSSEVRARHDVSAVTKLMISSAPARRDTKLEIMDYFKNSGLFELYGSTEAGWVTMQIKKFGLREVDEIPLHTYAEAARLDSFAIHAGDADGLLKGTRLDQVASLEFGGLHFAPESLSRANQQDELRLTTPDADAKSKLHSGDSIVARVTLKDGRVLDLTSKVDAHNGACRFTWSLGPAAGPSVVEGVDFCELTPDGRLIEVVGFIDKMPG